MERTGGGEERTGGPMERTGDGERRTGVPMEQTGGSEERRAARTQRPGGPAVGASAMDTPDQVPAERTGPRRRWRKPTARAAVALVLGAATTMGVAWWMASGSTTGTSAWDTLTVRDPAPMTWTVQERRLESGRVRSVTALPATIRSSWSLAPIHSRQTARLEVSLRSGQPEGHVRFVRSLDDLAHDATAETRSAFLQTAIGRLATEGWGHVPEPDPGGDCVIARSLACGWPMLSCWGWQSITFISATRAQTPQALVITPVELDTVGLINPPPVTLRGPSLSDPRGLPFLPVWPGFFINTLFYALPWWLLLLLPGVVRRDWRRRHGRCVGCGYSLAGLLADGDALRCPECGAPSPLAAVARTRNKTA